VSATERERVVNRMAVRKWAAANPDKILAAGRKRYAANPAKYLAAKRAWNAANPEKVKASRRRDYLAHQERIRAAARKWSASNRDKQIESQRRWRIAHPQKALEHARKWKKLNKRAVCISASRRRARKRGNGGSHTLAEWIVLCWASAWRCAYCGCVLDEKTVTCDHRVPIARGGSDDIENITLACLSCNSRKWAKTPDEFLPKRAAA
jgi:5-methylcytosine-specific restriction endonuclease McrA